MCGVQNMDCFLLGENAASDTCKRPGEDRELGRRSLWIYGNGKDTVGTSGHKTLEMNDAFVELADDDASSASSEPETVQVHNPSLFSHRATVEDLIASFRRHIIGPLAGVDIKEDSSATAGASPVIVISDADSQKSLDCALEKWRVEQEEKELEMRWRATKRVSENWLTKVEAVRERHKERHEKVARERDLKKKKAGSGAAGALVSKDPSTSHNVPQFVPTPQLYPSIQQPQPPYAVPQASLAPSQLAFTACHPSTSVPQLANNTAFTFVPPQASSSLSAFPPAAISKDPSSSTQTAPSLEHASSASARCSHASYDPRSPDLTLDDLIHDVIELGLPSPLPPPERPIDFKDSESGGMTMAESILAQQAAIPAYLQHYIDAVKMQMLPSSLLPHSAPPSQDPILSSLPSPSKPATLSATFPDVVEDSSILATQLEEALLYDSPQWLAYDGWLELANTRFHPNIDQGQLAVMMGTSPAGGSRPPDGQRIQETSTRQNLDRPKQEPPVIIPVTPSEPTAEEKKIWHIWSLGQAPPSASADAMLRDLQASRPADLTPMVLNLLPEFTGNRDDAARLKFLTGSPSALEDPSTVIHMQLATMKAGWAWTSLSSTTIPFNEANASLMMAPRSVLVNPAYSTFQPLFASPSPQIVSNHTASQDQSTSYVTPSASTSRPSPVLKTHDLPPSLRTSYADSPMSSTSTPTSTTALFNDSGESANSASVSYIPCMPIGDRFFRIARVANVDVLRPSYWFEPDVTATEHIRNLVDLMEEYGGWKRPERKTRVFNRERKACGPDDLASFDHCFVLDIDTTVST